MQVKFSYPMWGSEHLPLDVFFRKIKDAGYHAVEMGIGTNKAFIQELRKGLKDYGLSLIAQQCMHEPGLNATAYAEKMVDYLYHLADFKPIFINSHTGRDYYLFEENCRIFELCEEVEQKSATTIVHETHRGRALFSTNSSKQFFDAFPSLKIAADFSHWCCVSESLLQEQNDFLELAFKRANYIHARVGNEQSPQVNHPAAPENKDALNAHLTWWKAILNEAKQRGENEFWICTEFGPAPYMPSLPYTQQTVANQFEVNLTIKKIIQTELLDFNQNFKY